MIVFKCFQDSDLMNFPDSLPNHHSARPGAEVAARGSSTLLRQLASGSSAVLRDIPAVSHAALAKRLFGLLVRAQASGVDVLPIAG